jgi:hypothetical protein
MGDQDETKVQVAALLLRAENLERRVQVLESLLKDKSVLKKLSDGLIGVDGLKAEYSKLFVRVDPKNGETAAHFFFDTLGHCERVCVLSSCLVISGNIDNDPFYYLNALEVMQKDSMKAFYVIEAIMWRLSLLKKEG